MLIWSRFEGLIEILEGGFPPHHTTKITYLFVEPLKSRRPDDGAAQKTTGEISACSEY